MQALRSDIADTWIAVSASCMRSSYGRCSRSSSHSSGKVGVSSSLSSFSLSETSTSVGKSAALPSAIKIPESRICIDPSFDVMDATLRGIKSIKSYVHLKGKAFTLLEVHVKFQGCSISTSCDISMAVSQYLDRIWADKCSSWMRKKVGW